MTEGTLEANFKKDGNDILVDLKFGRKKPWNPLSIIGVGGNTGKEYATERVLLKKRVFQLENKLCNITDKLDQCEHGVEGHDEVEDEPEPIILESDSEETTDIKDDADVKSNKEAESKEKAEASKTDQNFMALLQKRQRKRNRKELKKVSAQYDPLKASPDKRNNQTRIYASSKHIKTIKPYRLSNSVDWQHITNWAQEKTTINLHKKNAKKKLCYCDNKSVNFNLKPPSRHKGVQTVFMIEKGVTANWNSAVGNGQGKSIHKGSRIFSNEPVTKNNIKAIIDEAVVDSIGRTLQKYFKEGLEDYIKKRIDSAVIGLNEDGTSCYTAQTHTKSATDVTDDIFREKGRACISSTINTGMTDSKSSLDDNRLAHKEKGHPRSTSRYSDIQRWVNKRQRLRPLEIKTVFNVRKNDSAKTLNVIKNESQKPAGDHFTPKIKTSRGELF